MPPGSTSASTTTQLAAVYGEFAGRGFCAPPRSKAASTPTGTARRLGIVTDVMGGQRRSPALMLDANECWSAAAGGPPRRRARGSSSTSPGSRSRSPLGRRRPRRGAPLRYAPPWPPARTSPGSSSFVPLLNASAVDVVQTGSVWGITHFLRVAALAHGHGLPVSPVGYNTNPLAAAAAAVPNHLRSRCRTSARRGG